MTRQAAKTPTILFVGSKLHPWRMPPIFRVQARYDTPTTVACEPLPEAADERLHAQAGRSTITLHQHLVYAIVDEAAWSEIQAQHQTCQTALNQLANRLRACGSYATQLAAAGGLAQAPNPLSPTVIACSDPDRATATGWAVGHAVPSMEREGVLSHTAKMLRATSAIFGDYTAHQRDHFVCASDAVWAEVWALHAAATDQHAAWEQLLRRLVYHDFAIGESTALAITPANAVVGIAMMSRAEAEACLERIKANLDSLRRDLLALNEQEGWKALGYDSWRACVTAEFGQSQSALYRQLAAAEVERDLGLPLGTLPESHVRPLGRLESPVAKQQALERADELAGDAPRQAKHVQQAVQEQVPGKLVIPPALHARARAVGYVIRPSGPRWALLAEAGTQSGVLCADLAALESALTLREAQRTQPPIDSPMAKPMPSAVDLIPAWLIAGRSAQQHYSACPVDLSTPRGQQDMFRLALTMLAASALALDICEQELVSRLAERMAELRNEETHDTTPERKNHVPDVV